MSDEVEKLQAQIADLKRQLQWAKRQAGPTCTLCGGKASKSTKYEYYYCQQESGLCGILWLGVRHGQGGVFVTFHRTEMDAVMNPLPWKRLHDNGLRLKKWFIGDKEVSQGEYEGKCTGTK